MTSIINDEKIVFCIELLGEVAGHAGELDLRSC
jgi:hypothetical protein